MKSANVSILFVTLILLVFLMGCKEQPLSFSVRYDTLGELKSNVPVYFEKTRIGHIEKIVSTDRGDFQVEISIVPEHKDKATTNSKFYILDDPFDSDRKVLVVEQDHPGGTGIIEGSIVQGEKSRGFLDQLMSNFKVSSKDASKKMQIAMRELKEDLKNSSKKLNGQMEKSLDDIDTYFQKFSNSIDSSLTEENLQDLESTLDDFVEQFNSLSEEIQNLIREEVLPQLRRNLEALRKKLEQEGREDDIDKIDQQLNQIARV